MRGRGGREHAGGDARDLWVAQEVRLDVDPRRYRAGLTLTIIAFALMPLNLLAGLAVYAYAVHRRTLARRLLAWSVVGLGATAAVALWWSIGAPHPGAARALAWDVLATLTWMAAIPVLVLSAVALGLTRHITSPEDYAARTGLGPLQPLAPLAFAWVAVAPPVAFALGFVALSRMLSATWPRHLTMRGGGYLTATLVCAPVGVVGWVVVALVFGAVASV